MDVRHWIFLSPHLDDAALSCGGLLWDLAQNGHQVEIWTLFAGNPPDEDFSPFAQQMHQDWGVTGAEAAALRKAEDQRACEILGVEYRHFNYLDAIYRRDQVTGKPVVNNNNELFGKPPEKPLINDITQQLLDLLPSEAALVSPMGLGTHLDHLAVLKAAEETSQVPHYYADYPYILKEYTPTNERWETIFYPLNEAALRAWQEAVLTYNSQIGQFWRDDAELRLCLRNYMAGGGGRLWKSLTLNKALGGHSLDS